MPAPLSAQRQGGPGRHWAVAGPVPQWRACDTSSQSCLILTRPLVVVVERRFISVGEKPSGGLSDAAADGAADGAWHSQALIQR